MEDLIAETERNTDKLTEEIIGCETSEKQQTTLNSCVNSVSVETNINQIEYFVKNKKTQTHAIVPSKSTKSVGTQTFITSDYLSKKLFPKLVSSSSQTSPIPDDCEMNTVDEIDKPTSHSCRNEDDTHSSMIVHKGNSQLTMDPMELIPTDDIDHGGENSGDEFSAASDEGSEEGESEISDSDEERISDERITLTSDKLPKDQLKFIICEESIAKTFCFCFKCNAHCTVFVERRIGSYCQIGVFCSSYSEHNFYWTTGPLCNRLPILNLMIASSILCTGMECSKTLRFMESLNILCFKRREFSNLQGAYVIPAVFNVWKKEQLSLLDGIKDKPICIASDMRVDSPGHSGLIGSGSTLDVDRNVILDTQVIKVICLWFSIISTAHAEVTSSVTEVELQLYNNWTSTKPW